MITYLCGGINGLNDSDCRDWREVAKALLKTETLDPMRRDYRGKEDDSVEDIVAGDLVDIAQSDFILVNATRPSWGTAMEIVYAFQQGKRITAFVGGAKVSPWLRYHAFVWQTVEEAVSSINEDVRWNHLERK
jgi:nucleoside 2-deoxyribosyltransferase